MDKITDLLNNISLDKILPKLESVTDWVQWLIAFAVRVGPVCILLLGLIYLLIPPKEANHVAGYRTYFGMGSVRAWRFTQLIAGAIMTLVGLVLTIISNKAVDKFEAMNLMEMAEKAFSLIKTQIICAAVIYVFMFLLMAVLFDRKGRPRFKAMANIMPTKKQPAEEIQEISEEEAEELLPQEELPVEYEQQGQQVITADDIVIEGLD